MHVTNAAVENPGIPAEPSRRVGLCLSGGGFRATLFHVGSLRRLNELCILSRVAESTSVSGGSITNGVLATRWERLKASEQEGVFTVFDELVARPIYEFCRKDLRTQVLLWDRLNPLDWPKFMRSDYSATDRVALRYAEDLDLGGPLTTLPTSASFVFCATNLENGTIWTFDRASMGDWFVGRTPCADTSVAQAVAASSAFPVTFPPLRLSFEPARTFSGGHGNAAERQEKAQVTLTDGGVYDNLGLEPVRTGFAFLLVSDAGAPLHHEEMPSLNPYTRVTRSLDAIWNQVGAQRKRWLIELFESKRAEGAYWGLSSKVANYHLPGAPGYPDEVVELISRVRTDLDPFTEGEIACLENQGYAMANAAVLRWATHLLPAEIPDFRWPFPEFAAEAAAKAAVKDSADRGVFQDVWRSMKGMTTG